jgi:cell division protein FtsN
VAAFRTQAEAETMTLRLRHSGEEAYWQKSEGDKPWFRVRLGGFQSQDDAKKHAEALVSRKMIDNYYVANFIDGYYSIP